MAGLPKQLKRHRKQRNTRKLYSCKQCGMAIRIPKGKGQTEITCPKCRYKFIERT